MTVNLSLDFSPVPKAFDHQGVYPQVVVRERYLFLSTSAAATLPALKTYPHLCSRLAAPQTAYVGPLEKEDHVLCFHH